MTDEMPGLDPDSEAYSPEVRRPELTEQQRRVVVLVAQGWTTEEIAHRLGISVHTVNAHRRAALVRAGVKSAVGLTHLALVNGWTDVGYVPGEAEEPIRRT